jgi:hypothetical protein
MAGAVVDTCRLTAGDAAPPGLVTTRLQVRDVVPGVNDAVMLAGFTLLVVSVTGVPPV